MSSVAFPKPEAKRAPLRAGQHRRKYIRARRPKRLDRAGSDIARLDWTRAQPCMLWGPECQGRSEAHHAGKNPGVGMKAGDATAVPLCGRHHRQITDKTGRFRSMSREEMRDLQDEWVADAQARYLSAGNRRAR
jgi:hypothetical protein